MTHRRKYQQTDESDFKGRCPTNVELPKPKFIEEHEASGLLSSSGIKTFLSKIPLVGPLLFYEYKMNEKVTKFLLAGDKFMPENHLRQPGFTCSACGPFTKNKERLQKLKKSQKIQDISIKMNQIKLLFNMRWLVEILKI